MSAFLARLPVVLALAAASGVLAVAPAATADGRAPASATLTGQDPTAAAAPARRRLWKPNPARGSFSLDRTFEGATLTMSGSGFRGRYEAYTWPENMGWQPVKGSPAANVSLTYSYRYERSGYYECQRTGAEYSASGSANLELVTSDYRAGFQLGGPTVFGDLFARTWKVKDRAFELQVTLDVPFTRREWSEDLDSAGGCVVVESPYNGTEDVGITVWLKGRLGADNKTVTIESFTMTGFPDMPNAFALDDPPASGTFVFSRDLRIRR